MYHNIIEWNQHVKEFLVGIKMGKEEGGLICKCSCFLLVLGGGLLLSKYLMPRLHKIERI